jgi:PhnB protein
MHSCLLCLLSLDSSIFFSTSSLSLSPLSLTLTPLPFYSSMTTSTHEKWQRAGWQNLIPSLCVEGAKQALEFYKSAFNAEILDCMMDPTSTKVMHADIKIGGCVVFVSDPAPAMGVNPCPLSLALYVPDVDEAFKRAIKAGAKEKDSVKDQFWGDRTGCVVDPYGIKWTLATHLREVSPEEMQEAAERYSKEKQEQCATAQKGSK